MQFILFNLIIFIIIYQQLGSTKSTHNQYKRSILFPGGGTFKMVLGFAVPVKLGQKQSMACGWNFQFQYSVPKTTNDIKVYPPIISKSREKRAISDRALFYAALESIFNRWGLEGRDCLLYNICENAFLTTKHTANGLYGHLIHILLTPNVEDNSVGLDSIYLDAKIAGNYGVNCSTLYPKCKLDVHRLLNLITLIKDDTIQ